MNNYVKVGLLVLGIIAVVYLVQMYQKRKEGFEDAPTEEPVSMPTLEQCSDDKFLNEPSNRQKCDMMLAMKEKDTKVAEKVTEGFMVNSDGYAVMPSEELGRNETFKRLDEMGGAGAGGEFGLGGNMYPKDCFPKDQLTPAELLPGDANSKWAQSVPANPGELGDQNFLAAGFHVGINTVGQTLRNANRQLRSEPPNPQVKVSPWLQSTIEPDTNRRPLEIGGGCQ